MNIWAVRTLEDFQIITDFKTMGDHRHEDNVMITYNIYIVIRETGQFSSKGIINDFIGNLNRLTVSRRFTEQAV